MGEGSGVKIGKAAVAAVGQKYGRLSVVGVSHQNASSRWVMLCACECGGYTTRSVADLNGGVKRGSEQSCGCNVNGAWNRKHGLRGNLIYKVWCDMMGRCYNESHHAYGYYGGRGITVDERWHDPKEFIADRGERPEGCTVDRIDNNSGYSKGNCRWATRKEQMRNTRRAVYLTRSDGKRMLLVEWAELLGVRADRLRNRRAKGWTDDEIISGKREAA